MKQSYQKRIRLYCEKKLCLDNFIELNYKEFHYLKNVMRCKIEDEIILFNEIDNEFLAKIKKFNKKNVILYIQQKFKKVESLNDVYLIFSLVKRDQIEYIIQKATELGVKKIFPVITERSSKKELNYSRLKLIAKEACEQSERISIPKIMKLVTLNSLIKKWNIKRKILFADEILVENENKILNKSDFRSSALLVGPEGGFTYEENTMLKKHSFIFPITFGKGILKSDTSVVTGLSYLNLINSTYKINY